ncbi:hypothetical protein Sango_1956200 [Sesamum angolense]|uniref:Fanconi Anaemia group E protein C-terminal domain-containing protein n=1 Tax=Sesamum angolense TaxID=2727404 RepID=A0AAE1WEG9_9LAMI|nr:hypothetical protein Sango_1956200 [Sesamum angolense]
MEGWIPLFEIFLNSPCPECEASLWLQKAFNPSSNASPISTASFLSLLKTPSETTSIDPSSPRQMRNTAAVVQARILSFLAYDHQRFCKRDLCKLARVMLNEGRSLDFWVKKAAQRLLDMVSVSNYQWISHFNLDTEEENVEDEFYSMPDWLSDAAKDSDSVFTWLPMSSDELSETVPLTASGAIDVEPMAKSLKSRLLNVESTSEAVELGKEVHKLCSESKQNSLVVLDLIEPWSADDETAAVLISQLSNGSETYELGWPSHILCSIVLPKFLVLNEPASRVLMMRTIEYCKAHQTSAEYALLLPLILRNEGINNPICDVITRIIKESLHPGHVSAFCQKLLCEDKDARRFVCLPRHRCLISEELVWTDSLFSLWQNILNHNVHLTQDSVDQLVYHIHESADRCFGFYPWSVKFQEVRDLAQKSSSDLKL